MANQTFLELLQVAIGQRRSLSKVLTGEKWGQMHELLKKHALLGIGYVAIQKLPRDQWPPSNIVLSLTAYATQIKAKNVKLNEECREVVRQMEHDGIGAVVIKGQSNWENYHEELREYRQCGDIDIWTAPLPKRGEAPLPPSGGCCNGADKDEGIAIAVQTGDSVEYEYYKGVRGIIEYARLQRRLRKDRSLFKPLYYHVEYHTDKGTEVEMHYRPSFLCSPVRNMRMQRWFKEQFDVCLKNKCQLGFPVLTSSVNVVYQLVHLYRHVFEGGIGLRQLMDYYFALRVWHNDVMECKDLQSQGMWSEGLGTAVMSASEVMAVLRSFGMGKFAAAVMWVLNEAFENEECSDADEVGEQQLPDTAKLMSTYEISNERIIGQQLKKNNYLPWMICEPNEKEGRKLMAEIMRGGNFGQYDTRDASLKQGGMMKHGVWKLKRVMRLVSSYPEEALWEPVFRIWHLFWRMKMR